MSRIEVIYKPVGKPFQRVDILNSLRAMQELVGGNIETVRTPIKGTLIICNEEGLIRELKLNCDPFKPFGITIRGDFFICGVDGEEFSDCPNIDVLFNALMRNYENEQN